MSAQFTSGTVNFSSLGTAGCGAELVCWAGNLNLIKMTSAEPSRKTAYGRDIAVRVVWQKLGMDLSFRAIAKRLQIGVGSAYRLYRRYIETSEFSPPKRSSRPGVRKLDELHELYIIGLLMVNPGLYLAEICQKIKAATGVSVSGATVCRILQRNGYTRKKIAHIAKQRCVSYRGAFMAQIMHYPSSYLVWIDETGSDHRDHIRKFGYQIRGLPPVYRRLVYRGVRISAIAAISSEGLITHELLTGTTNGEIFLDFLRGSLIPSMQSFPATRSVVIMDNCSIHHVQQVKQLLEAAGILLIFLPPYSPDYNPCEEMFSYIKYYLKDHDELLQSMDTRSCKHVLHSAFESITESQCKNWISHAGYN